MPSRSIIRTGVGPHREPGNHFPAMAAAINLLAARAARVQSRRNLSRSLSPKLDHSHSITRFDRSRTGPSSEDLESAQGAADGPSRPHRDGRTVRLTNGRSAADASRPVACACLKESDLNKFSAKLKPGPPQAVV